LKRLAGPLFSTLLPTMNVIDVLSDLAARIKRLREALVDPERSSYRIVLTPERTVLREAQRAETYLNLFNYPVDSVYVNRILSKEDVLGSHLDALVERQAQVMGEVKAAFGVLPQFAVPLITEEPVGVARLSKLARLVFGDRDPTDIMHHGLSQKIEAIDNGYVLRLPMPNVEVQRLDLTKRGDELFIDIGNFRREMALPLVLSDLEPGVARMQDGVLEIPFERQVATNGKAGR
jgi:arsenite-transporting ATPase